MNMECPDCKVVEAGLDDDGTPYREEYSRGFITKGDIRLGTLEIYGCSRCGGSGGGLEPEQDNPDYTLGKSWNDRMCLVGAVYGTGRIEET